MTLDFSPIYSLLKDGTENNEDGGTPTPSPEDQEERKKRNAIKEAGMMRGDLAKGIKAGESPINLLLKAIEIISVMMGDKTLYNQCTEDIRDIYGWGMGEPAPLKKELEDAKQRLEKLSRFASGEDVPPEAKARIETAIKAHKDLITTLEARLKAET